MNFQTAGIGSLVGFALSFLVALVSGIPLFDAFLRALGWALVLGAGTLGAELLLRSQVPDLFGSAGVAQEAPHYERNGETVNIVLDDQEPGSSDVEQMQETSDQVVEGSEAGRGLPPMAFEGVSSTEEPVGEIGSFLSSFNPAMDADGGTSEVPEFAPQENDSPESNESVVLYTPSKGADLEGLEQDPVILANAVKTVMNKT